jgi:16S rRNA G966 N2-methylase RsmD
LKNKKKIKEIEEKIFNNGIKIEENEDLQNQIFREDWQLSQFWYTEETSEILAKEIIKQCKNGKIACVSTPSVFKTLKKLSNEITNEYYIFEYDMRFKLYGEHFIYYDYNEPLNLPEKMKGYFDCIMVDPPFLSEECLSKISQTIQYLSKSKETLIFLVTGKQMEFSIKKIFQDSLQICYSFIPKHKNLMNLLVCYTNCRNSSFL